MTYTIYELKLKPISSWITDLTADTIFGHLCWQIKYEFGDDVLEKFLEEMKNKPIFTISDVIFQNNYPKPLVNEIFSVDENINEDFYNRNKDFIKDNIILAKHFRKIIDSKDLKKDILSIKKKYVKNKSKIDDIIKNNNIVNRLAWTTLDNWIYSQEEKQSDYSCSLFLKILDEDKFNKYKKEINWKQITLFDLLKNVFVETWYWKKKSTGKWIFELIKDKDWNIKDWEEKTLWKQEWNNILLLSSFIPSKNDPTEGNYKLFTKFPKMWEEFSIEWQKFYKKPLVMIQAGATFKKNKNYEWYVWKMIKNVNLWKFYREDSNWNKKEINFYHYAYGFTLEF